MARRAFQWLCLNEWVLGGDLTNLFNDLDDWRALDPQAWAVIEPILVSDPFAAFTPEFEARRLDWLGQTWPDRDLSEEVQALESRFHAPCSLYDTQVRNILILRETLMGYYLRHNDPDRYNLHLQAVLSNLDELCNPAYVIDFVRLGAGCDDPEQVQRFLDHSQALLRWNLDEGRLPGFAAVPQLALLAIAYDRNKKPSSSEAVFSTMRTLLAEPSQTALWLVDALERCGKHAEAQSLLEQLSREGLIPRSRGAVSRDSDPSRKDMP